MGPVRNRVRRQPPRRAGGVDERERERRLALPLADIGLSVRTVNTLENDNLLFVRDVVVKPLKEMKAVTNLGKTAFKELVSCLERQGVYVTDWGMVPPRPAKGGKG